ncbi:helix-turn-helix domain-containing protein [bacterium]|nr:helix-turn-helix domain-containing protein [bacterium]
MAIEYMTFEDVLAELQIDEEELKKLVSQGELRGFRDGLSMKFKKDDVLNLKQGRETEPTIILTDSDQEMGIAESSDELILEDSTSDTVINIGDIMAPGKGGKAAGSQIEMGNAATSDQQEIIFDTSGDETGSAAKTGSSATDPEAAIPTVEVPSVSEDMGLVETDSDAQLVEVGSDESMETEAFELMEESGESAEGGGVAVAPVKGRSGAVRRAGGQSARLRSLAIEQKRPHALFTAFLLFGILFLALNGGVAMNTVQGVAPEWLEGWTGTFRSITEGVFGVFNG